MAGLSLSELTLSHFRSHRRVDISADGRPVAIFGANGAGKTNILEAISMLSPGRGLRRAKMEDIARKPEALGWKVSACLTSLGQLHELETSSEGGAGRTVRVDGKLAPQTALGRIARIVWLVPAMDRLWLEGADGRRRFLDRITLSFEPKHAEVSVAYEKAMRERNRLLKDMVRDAMWYSALEQQMAEAGAQIIANRAMATERLSAAMAEAETAFPTASLSIENPEDADLIDSEAALLSALQASRQTDLRAGRSLVGPHRADLGAIYTAKGVEAKQCSTGEQKALLLSLILANARALAQDFGAAPLILLDEVAAHLDADRRAALYDEICALKAQAWMTGTGAELFAELGGRAQHFEVSEHNGQSELHLR
ncbi:DNA replication and repair protein RecF [Litoreibacter ponti]|uniref:DNA replication and repair protein RecF n=1 Tax=Litoreibacter ponti TaxID=1510457 RepID=A0A2T6BNE9_9RHOB|nr:DNA replication/repair protein RecF [Litoreibacter ponti]PTX57595.1 DNA replication and repair protein RecF [Litoreibacter ponti]